MKLKFVCICLSLFTVSSCAVVEPRKTDFCQALNVYASQIPGGETRTLTFGRGGLWMVDHYTYCGGSVMDESTKSFCAWVSKNTSAEFMEANINRAISCLQSQKINGYLGNTGIQTWSGKVVFYYTKSVPDTEITLEYEKAEPATEDESFMKFTLVKNNK